MPEVNVPTVELTSAQTNVGRRGMKTISCHKKYSVAFGVEKVKQRGYTSIDGTSRLIKASWLRSRRCYYTDKQVELAVAQQVL